MTASRKLICGLSFFAILALFFKLPQTPSLFSFFECKSCSSPDPFLPLIGAGYFSCLAALCLLFPVFPGRLISTAGIAWALALALILSYLPLPRWCPLCLVCHLCHILIWALWRFSPQIMDEKAALPLGTRVILTVVSATSVIALLGSCDILFLVYDVKRPQLSTLSAIKVGDQVPDFAKNFAENHSAENFVINFVSPSCTYCKEQLPQLSAVVAQLVKSRFHVINISSELKADLLRNCPEAEWIEDSGAKWRTQFKVSGYPTLYVVSRKGEIKKVITGVPGELKRDLLALGSAI